VTGYVRNEDDGTVTGEAQGDDDGLKSFLNDIKKGPPLASVTSVETKHVDVKEGEKSFAQRR
jgi:acylphosphatase